MLTKKAENIKFGEGMMANNNSRETMITTEVKKQVILAVPLIGLQFILQVISLMFIGHLGYLALTGASTTTSFASVTAFSLLAWITFLPSSLVFTYEYVIILNFIVIV